jgi:hypothetical protein
VAAALSLDDDAGAARVERALAPVHRPDCPDQLGEISVLDEVSLRTLLDGLEDQPLVRECGQDEDPAIRETLGHGSAQAETIAITAARQLEVQQHNVWPDLRYHRYA